MTYRPKVQSRALARVLMGMKKPALGRLIEDSANLWAVLGVGYSLPIMRTATPMIRQSSAHTAMG